MGARIWSRLVLDVRGALAIVRAVPAGGLVAIIVGLSTVAWASYSPEVGGPIVFSDELIHGQLARSLADGHLPSVRGDVVWGYGIVSAVLGAFPIRLGGDMDRGYALLKVLNSFVMSLAAIPAYLLGRRLLRPSGAVVVGGLTVAVPSMVFTALVMTESVFYPLFLGEVLLIVRALERPSVGRQVCVLSGLALAYLTRPQALVILPAYLCAIGVKAWLDRRSRASTAFRLTGRGYGATFVILGVAVVVGVGATLARGASPVSLLGAYTVLATSYSPVETIRWSLVNLADLDLYVGVVGLAGFVLGVAPGFDRRASTAATRLYVAVAVPLVVLFVVQIGAFATTPWGGARIHDRNLFYVVPLLLIGLVAWIERGLPRPRRLTASIAVAVAALPALIPFNDLVTGAWVDQIGIVAWLSGIVQPDLVKPSMMAAGLAGAVLILVVPVRWRWLLVGVVGLVFFVQCTAARWQAHRGGSTTAPNPAWIDEAVGRDASVSVLFVDSSHCASLPETESRWIVFWRSEFFNRSVNAPTSIGRPQPGSTRLPRAHVARGGDVLLRNGEPLTVSYLLLDSRIGLERATVVAESRSQQLAVWKVNGPVTLRHATQRRTVELVCGDRGR